MNELLAEHRKLIDAAKKKEHEKTKKEVLLPYWPDSIRGIANSILRSSLFSVVKKGERKALDRELLATQSGVEIRYTGLQLDQLDLAVWECLIHIARLHPLGSKVSFNLSEALTHLHKTFGKENYEWFKNCIGRLNASGVEIKYDRKTYAGSLVQNFYRNEDNNDYIIILDPKLSYLYAPNEWTKLRAEDRLSLSGKPLALWLHGYYATHAEPFPIKLETIHHLSGSSCKAMRSFKQTLKIACSQVSEVTGWIFEIKNGLLLIKKSKL
jgi:hypothetical protein